MIAAARIVRARMVSSPAWRHRAGGLSAARLWFCRPLILVLRQLPHHLVEVEARGLLPDWEFLEAPEPSGDEGLRRYEQEDPVHRPVCIELALRPALEGIGTQIVKHRGAQLRELTLPDPE